VNVFDYPYSLYKRFIEAYEKIMRDEYQNYKVLIATCARAAQVEKASQFKKFLKPE